MYKLLENAKVFVTWMACLLLSCTDADEGKSSCSICIMASIRCSGRLLQALLEPDSGQISWTFSAVLRPTGIAQNLVAEDSSWDPCCTHGLTVFCGRKKPSSPERLWPTSAGWFAGGSRSSFILLRGECVFIDNQEASQMYKAADKCYVIAKFALTGSYT